MLSRRPQRRSSPSWASTTPRIQGMCGGRCGRTGTPATMQRPTRLAAASSGSTAKLALMPRWRQGGATSPSLLSQSFRGLGGECVLHARTSTAFAYQEVVQNGHLCCFTCHCTSQSCLKAPPHRRDLPPSVSCALGASTTILCRTQLLQFCPNEARRGQIAMNWQGSAQTPDKFPGLRTTIGCLCP